VKLKDLISSLSKTPELDRLASAVAQAWIDLDKQVGAARTPTTACVHSPDALRTGGSRPTDPNALAAQKYLILADQHLISRNLQSGWDSFQSAQRELLACDIDKVQRAAVGLRREAKKISGWRGDAIIDFLDKAKTPDPKAPWDVKWILDAVALRDDYFQTTYFKITLRRRHLRRLSVGLAAMLALFLVLSWFGVFDEVLDKPALVTAVIIFGILGACVSVGQGFLWSDVAAKIPTQQLGASAVWVRPAIGAAAALAALALLRAGNIKEATPAFVLAIAFTAGYSERYIVGAVDHLAKSEEKKSSG